jgi:hypothetical protein
MKLLLTCALLFSVQAAKLPPRKLVPQQASHKLVWYLTDEGKGVQCSGKPHPVLLKSGSIARAVEGCRGRSPQVILHD